MGVLNFLFLLGGVLYAASTELCESNTEVPSVTANDLGRYELTSVVLGEGASATVRLGFDRETREKVAIKEISKLRDQPEKAEKRRRAIEKELDILRFLGSLEDRVNCAVLLGAAETDDSYFLVFEYKEANLHSFIKQRRQLHEEEARKLFKQLVQAVAFLHKHKVAHRDIKIEVSFWKLLRSSLV